MSNVIEFPTSRELTIDKAAKYVGLSVRTLRRYMDEKKGPRRAKRYGRWFFLPEDLDSWLRARTEVVEAYCR